MTRYRWTKAPPSTWELRPQRAHCSPDDIVGAVRYHSNRRWLASVDWNGSSNWWLVGSPAQGRRLVEEWLCRKTWDWTCGKRDGTMEMAA